MYQAKTRQIRRGAFVCFLYHIGWKSWKLIARIISPNSNTFALHSPKARPPTYSQRNMQSDADKFWGD